MLSRKERGQTKEKIDRDTKREGRKTASRQARERSTDQDENFLNESSSSEDDDETKPGAVEIAGPKNMEARREQLPREGSNSDAIDDTNTPAIVVKADLAPEVVVADGVHIQEEEADLVNKRRILWFVFVLYGIVIICIGVSFVNLFLYPPLVYGRIDTSLWTNQLGPAACLLLVDTILMFIVPRTRGRCCCSISLDGYAVDDKQFLRDSQMASAGSLCILIFVAIPILGLLPKLQWLGFALTTCVFAGTVFAFLRVWLLLRPKETRQEKSKAFWAVFVVFFIALGGAAVWRCLNPIYPDCVVEDPNYIGDGWCDGGVYNTEECGYDGGDCVNEKYPDCLADNPSKIGDGTCDGGLYVTAECGNDGGDCLAFLYKYPGCIVDQPYRVGDGICDGSGYNTKSCRYDGGDCDGGAAMNGTYPDCHVEHPSWIGDGFCDGGVYMTVECAYDGSDCLAFLDKYPDCHVDQPNWIGDGICDGWVYMAEECAYDGGDCLAFIDKYPDCHVEDPSLIGDGTCDGGRYMTSECAYDGGDCLAFMDQYPGCIAGSPLLIGDGVCNPAEPYNTRACGYDGGDCDAVNDAKYPGCHVENPSRIGDGTCDGRLYGTAECGFDGGDCLEAGKPCRGHRECASQSCNATTNVCDSGVVSEQYPDCRVPMPQWIGDGVCDGGYYASEACGFDGGDCLQVGEPCLQDDECASGFCNNSTKVCYLGILQDYPDCVVEYPRKIGDGTCNFGEYLTEECGYDGGDCLY